MKRPIMMQISFIPKFSGMTDIYIYIYIYRLMHI